MTVNERLADYRRQPVTTVGDPRWEAIIIDMRAGWVWLEAELRAGVWRIKVRDAGVMSYKPSPASQAG